MLHSLSGYLICFYSNNGDTEKQQYTESHAAAFVKKVLIWHMSEKALQCNTRSHLFIRANTQVAMVRRIAGVPSNLSEALKILKRQISGHNQGNIV